MRVCLSAGRCEWMEGGEGENRIRCAENTFFLSVVQEANRRAQQALDAVTGRWFRAIRSSGHRDGRRGSCGQGRIEE